MTFKTYTKDDKAIILTSISQVASYCGCSIQEARKAYYQGVSRINGHTIINYTHN